MHRRRGSDADRRAALAQQIYEELLQDFGVPSNAAPADDADSSGGGGGGSSCCGASAAAGACLSARSSGTPCWTPEAGPLEAGPPPFGYPGGAGAGSLLQAHQPPSQVTPSCPSATPENAHLEAGAPPFWPPDPAPRPAADPRDGESRPSSRNYSVANSPAAAAAAESPPPPQISGWESALRWPAAPQESHARGEGSPGGRAGETIAGRMASGSRGKVASGSPRQRGAAAAGAEGGGAGEKEARRRKWERRLERAAKELRKRAEAAALKEEVAALRSEMVNLRERFADLQQQEGHRGHADRQAQRTCARSQVVNPTPRLHMAPYGTVTSPPPQSSWSRSPDLMTYNV
ncbi:hypothetical protein DIPPA_15110 [Diplonema papillatum]|nr:hypothetical protein DIPPA_15110 [Diplonema papillatum]